MTSTAEQRARWRETYASRRERAVRDRASRLTPPPGWTPVQARDLAVRIAGAVIGSGGGAAELGDVLRATGLLYDPEQISGTQLAHAQSHPFGERNR